MMEVLLNKITDTFLDYVSQYSFFIEGDYYKNLFSTYFSVAGFIIGFVFVVLVYCSSAEEQKKAGFFKVLPIIAVINSCTVLMEFINPSFHQQFQHNSVEAMVNAPDNIISGFILTLVISSCYKDYGGRAFLFGITTHLAMPMLNFSSLEYIAGGIQILYIIMRIVLVGFVCLIISHRKHFFTSWIWYFCFHMFIRIAAFFLQLLSDYLIQNAVRSSWKYILNSLLAYLPRYSVDALVFAVVLVFAIVFEKGVLAIKPARKTV